MHELQLGRTQWADLPSQTGEIRLNLGGRDKPIEGFLSVDLSPDHDVDIKTDVSDLRMFDDESVTELYCSQILEHFPHVKTQSVLEEWCRVLKPGGRITIGVPDFDRAIQIYQKCGLAPWVINFLYGDQEYPLAFHYTAFTFPSLAALLNKVGFREIRRIAAMPHGIKDRSALVSTVDGRDVSLNVTAVK